MGLRLKSGLFFPIITLIWATLGGAGFFSLLKYSNTPGEAAHLSSNWPERSKIFRDRSKPSLVVFVHPLCPCSEATLGELERLMPKLSGKVTTTLVFFWPNDKSEEWVKRKFWPRVQAVPGLRSFLDKNGTEALQYDARTSGQTFLFDAKGKLIFAGGITPQRGHMGDSAGREAILAYVEHGQGFKTSAPVFGCSLREPEFKGINQVAREDKRQKSNP